MIQETFMRLKIFLVLGAVLLSACNQDNAPQQQAQNADKPAPAKVYEWKMVTTWPPNFPVFQTGVEKFAQDLDILSQGRLKVQIFAGGQLVPALQSFDAVSQGTVQMAHGAAYYWAGKVPAAQFMSAVPFGMTADGMNAWLYAGGGLELWRELYEPFGVVPFPMGNSGVQMGGWFNKRIDSLADLKGLKMRIPGLGGKVFGKAGGSPVLMAGGELYTALERGTLDATEWVGPYHDQRLGLNRAAKYYYYPGWHEPGTTLELIVNKQAWETLPPDLQRLIEVASEAINQWMFNQFETMNLNALQELKEGKTEVLEFPADVMAELHRLSFETLEEEAAKDPDFKKVYDAYQAFRKRNDEWNAISDTAYERLSREAKR
jgi:TRAP-type mannitol/chloroaromatic compound transport system substrate-binding protein